jgi:hypothetical protein
VAALGRSASARAPVGPADLPESVFPSAEAMEQVLAMGAEEGLKQAVGQIDAILVEDTVPKR